MLWKPFTHYRSIIGTLYPKLYGFVSKTTHFQKAGSPCVSAFVCMCVCTRVLVLTCIIYTACLHCLGTLLFSVGVKHPQRAQLSSVHQQPLHNISGPVWLGAAACGANTAGSAPQHKSALWLVCSCSVALTYKRSPCAGVHVFYYLKTSVRQIFS